MMVARLEMPAMIACSGCGHFYPKCKLAIYGLIPLLIYCDKCLERIWLEEEEGEE